MHYYLLSCSILSPHTTQLFSKDTGLSHLSERFFYVYKLNVWSHHICFPRWIEQWLVILLSVICLVYTSAGLLRNKVIMHFLTAKRQHLSDKSFFFLGSFINHLYVHRRGRTEGNVPQGAHGVRWLVCVNLVSQCSDRMGFYLYMSYYSRWWCHTQNAVIITVTMLTQCSLLSQNYV